MSAKRLIIFDCDGTLVDSQHLIVAAMSAAFEAASLAPPPRKAILGIVGLSLPEAIWRLTEGGDEETARKVLEGYRDAFGLLRQDPQHDEPMYEGAREAVLRLAAEPETVLGIATGKSQKGVRKVLERFDLMKCFATIQTADDAPSKPHPGMIENALEETGANPDNAIMIGDTTFDMEMAKNAGVRALGVSWGYHPSHVLEEVGIHGLASDYSHLLDLLDNLSEPSTAAV